MDFAAYALGKPGAWVDEPWAGDQLAMVGDKIFAFLGDGTTIGLKCGKSRKNTNEWLQRYPGSVVVMPHMDRQGWVLITPDAIDPQVIKAAIDLSYDLVVAKLPRSQRPG